MKRADKPKSIGKTGAILVRMKMEMRRAVLAEMRPAHELVVHTGRNMEEMRRNLVQWLAESRIFSVKHLATEYFPPFALNPNAGYRPYLAVAEVLSILHELRWGGDWGIASWFVGVNGYLDAQRPMDLLAEDPEWVINAARDEVISEKYPHG